MTQDKNSTASDTASDIIKRAGFQDEWSKKNFDAFKNTSPGLARQPRCKNCIEKSVTTIRIEQGISFEQVFYILYILFFIVVFILSF